MEAFFVRVLTSVLENPQVQALIGQLFADAVNAAKADILAEITKLESGMVESIEALPAEILGDASTDVGKLLHEITGTTSDIAGAVKGEVSPLIPTAESIQDTLVGVLSKLPGGNLLGGLFGK